MTNSDAYVLAGHSVPFYGTQSGQTWFSFLCHSRLVIMSTDQ